MYNNEVVHIIGGITEVIGTIDQGEHPNGEGWVRVNNPCITMVRQNKDGGHAMYIAVMGGPSKDYQAFTDLYIPPNESLMEIRVLDKDGGLYKTYMDQINRPAVRNIILPGQQNLLRAQVKH